MSNNLGLPQVAPNQQQADVTINDMSGDVDAAITAALPIELSGLNPVEVLTNAEFREHVAFVLDDGASPPPTGVGTLQIPAISRGIFAVVNNSLVDVDVVIGDGSPAPTVQVASGSALLIHTDGVNLSAPDPGASLGGPYDVGCFAQGVPTNSELLLRFTFVRTVDFPASMSGSQARAAVAATAQTDFSVQKNGGSIGTVRFAAAGTVATFVGFGASQFVAGDVLSLHAPASADATLADIGFTFKGTR